MARLVIITKNQPGVLGEITSLLGKTKVDPARSTVHPHLPFTPSTPHFHSHLCSHSVQVNIAQQLNVSREEVAYNVRPTARTPQHPPPPTPPLPTTTIHSTAVHRRSHRR